MSLLCILGFFLKVNVQNENIFAWRKFQIFLGCLIFTIILAAKAQSYI